MGQGRGKLGQVVYKDQIISTIVDILVTSCTRSTVYKDQIISTIVDRMNTPLWFM